MDGFVVQICRDLGLVSGKAKEVATYHRNVATVDNCSTAQVALQPCSQAVRYGGITREEMQL